MQAETVEPNGPPARLILSPRAALALAACIGLLAGYIDIGGLYIKKFVIYDYAYLSQNRGFPWTIPTSHLAILLVPGVLVAVANRLRPGLISVRSATWLFATLAIWGILLRMPLDGAASLVFAVGLGRLIGWGAVALGPRLPRLAAIGLTVSLAVLAGLAAATTGRRVLAEYRALARLPDAPPGAKNVILIVMDTVRADSLGLQGYHRQTTPNLKRWAGKGVRFDMALSPAPWTFPAHSSFFTGQWPYKLNSQFEYVLNAPYPTLAEFLGSRGYLTAGFVANNDFCSYETGLDRGFAHYEDYPLSIRLILGSSAPGLWLVKNVLSPSDPYTRKWIKTQSRDAPGINGAFLDWLSKRNEKKPFFAFLNYFDAHGPFVLPKGRATRFGLRPESAVDQQMLLDYAGMDKRALDKRQVTLVRDSYENCIALLDEGVEALLDELDRRGVLKDSVVVVTADHGEEFDEHGLFNHGYGLYLHEVHVPLLVLAPTAPAEVVVETPVSLRDLPATIGDLLGMSADSPFPGRSLAAHWSRPTGAGTESPSTSPAMSEIANPTVMVKENGLGPAHRGFTMSLVIGKWHYIRDSAGDEELYSIKNDPNELKKFKAFRVRNPPIDFREELLQLLANDQYANGPEDAYLRRYRIWLEYLIHGRFLSPLLPPESESIAEPNRM